MLKISQSQRISFVHKYLSAFLPLPLKNSASSDVIYLHVHFGKVLIRLSRVLNEDGRNYLLGPGVHTENIWFGKRKNSSQLTEVP
jgi:hypothetical protein